LARREEIIGVYRWALSGNYRRSYEEDQAIFTTYAGLAVFIVFLLLLAALPAAPFMTRALFRLLNLILIYTVAVMGLNVVTGYAGQISIGHAAFMGIGAYAAAIITRDIAVPLLGFGAAPFWYFVVLLPVCGLIGALAGAFVGLPSFRLKHLYLAIATLAFQVIFVWVVGHSTWLNQGGSIPVPRLDFFGLEISGSNRLGPFYYYVGLVLVGLLGFAFRNLLRTRYGRGLVAVRDNDRAADAMGINPGVLAFYNGSVIIESFELQTSITLLAMAIVGGLGTFPGSLIGPAFIMMLDPGVERAAGAVQQLFPPTVSVGTALRPAVFGLVIILFLIFEPRGLANWWRLLSQYFKRWPFRY
jgi:branched-chain amino acid transport system permease protein